MWWVRWSDLNSLVCWKACWENVHCVKSGADLIEVIAEVFVFRSILNAHLLFIILNETKINISNSVMQIQRGRFEKSVRKICAKVDAAPLTRADVVVTWLIDRLKFGFRWLSSCHLGSYSDLSIYLSTLQNNNICGDFPGRRNAYLFNLFDRSDSVRYKDAVVSLQMDGLMMDGRMNGWKEGCRPLSRMLLQWFACQCGCRRLCWCRSPLEHDAVSVECFIWFLLTV